MHMRAPNLCWRISRTLLAVPLDAGPVHARVSRRRFLGKVDGEQICSRLVGQVVWTALGLLLAAGLWRGGPRRFVAFGI